MPVWCGAAPGRKVTAFLVFIPHANHSSYDNSKKCRDQSLTILFLVYTAVGAGNKPDRDAAPRNAARRLGIGVGPDRIDGGRRPRDNPTFTLLFDRRTSGARSSPAQHIDVPPNSCVAIISSAAMVRGQEQVKPRCSDEEGA